MPEYLTGENLTESAKELSKVLSDIQSTWLSLGRGRGERRENACPKTL